MKYLVVGKIGHGSTSRVLLVKRIKSKDAVSAVSHRQQHTGSTRQSPGEVNPRQRHDDNGAEDKVYVLKEREANENAVEEARTLRQLSKHPCVIEFKDAFLVHGLAKICIVMEKAERDLKSELEECVATNTRIPFDVGIRWVTQIALGLEFLHSQGIAHRDVKPANLLILPDHRIVLGDFGTCRDEVEEEYGVMTILGTPLYLSPELLAGNSYGTKSDVWAFGCVVFEIATNGTEKAFQARTFEELRSAVLRNAVRTAKVTSSPYMDVIDRCLKQDPLQRSRIADIIQLPLIVRAIGAFVSVLVAHESKRLPENRLECLFQQTTSLGLKNTVLAGLQLGSERRRTHH